MSESSGSALHCDTGEMLVIHRVFRREFRLLPQMVRGVASGDTKRAALIAAHAREVLAGLHTHHSGEDELIWPKLLKRASLDTAMIERMEGQHHDVVALVERAQELLPTWAASADQATGTELAGVLSDLSTRLDEHLADEEAHALPVIANHISQDEWNELGEHGMSSMPKSRLPVFLGYMLEEATPTERQELMAKVPLPGRVIYKLIGERKFRKESTELRRQLA